MADLKHFLDFAGLEEYDKLIKEYIKTGSTDEIDKISAELTEINNALTVLNGDDSVEGSVDAKIKDAVDGLVDGAPEALDTLKEIAEWISEDETGTTALVNRVIANEDAIADLKQENADLKKYVDEQDIAVYNSIQAIEDLKIMSLFPVIQEEGQSAVDAIASLGAGQALELAENQTIAEDVAITKSCYIDANGATFEGQVSIPANVDVIIENATFSKPVVVM